MPEIRIALYQPDIPGNTGTILRLAACLGIGVDIIEPAGFDISDRNLKRAGMDYLTTASLTRHVNWERFEEWRISTGRRLLLASTKAALPYVDVAFRADDILLFGRESAGVPDHVHEKADERLIIPMMEGQRSINVAVSARTTACATSIRSAQTGASSGRMAGPITGSRAASSCRTATAT